MHFHLEEVPWNRKLQYDNKNVTKKEEIMKHAKGDESLSLAHCACPVTTNSPTKRGNPDIRRLLYMCIWNCHAYWWWAGNRKREKRMLKVKLDKDEREVGKRGFADRFPTHVFFWPPIDSRPNDVKLRFTPSSTLLAAWKRRYSTECQRQCRSLRCQDARRAVLREQIGKQKFNRYLLNCVYWESNIDGHCKWLYLSTDVI